MKYNSMDPDNYHGVTVAMKLMTHKTGRSWYKPTYVIRFGDLMIEIDEVTAVKLGDDLLDRASQVNDPESKFNENLRACFHPVTGTMTWPRP